MEKRSFGDMVYDISSALNTKLETFFFETTPNFFTNTAPNAIKNGFNSVMEMTGLKKKKDYGGFFKSASNVIDEGIKFSEDAIRDVSNSRKKSDSGPSKEVLEKRAARRQDKEKDRNTIANKWKLESPQSTIMPSHNRGGATRGKSQNPENKNQHRRKGPR